VPVSGRWYITHHAIERYMFARRMPDTDEAFERAESEMIEMMPRTAHKQTIGSMQLWRSGARDRQLRWVVSTAPHPHGDLPQVVWVGYARPPEQWWPRE
jgi:hypothetical protein